MALFLTEAAAWDLHDDIRRDAALHAQKGEPAESQTLYEAAWTLEKVIELDNPAGVALEEELADLAAHYGYVGS